MQTSDVNKFFRSESEFEIEEARKIKAEKTKDLGSPIDLPGKPLAVQIKNNDIWIAESDFAVRRVNLESGSTVQLYKGHTGPVTTLCLYADMHPIAKPMLLVSGSWDKSVKIWNTETKEIISSTDAHSDFVKCVFAVPAMKLLITSGSDRVARFWDFSDPWAKEPLKLLGVLSAHSRPVQCIAIDIHSQQSATLYTADSMGIIKVWELERIFGTSPSCRVSEKMELTAHRTGVTDIWYGQGQLWTGSADESAMLHYLPTTNPPHKPIPPLIHPKPVKALLPLALTVLGEPYLLTAYNDVIRVYDVSEPASPEILHEVDAHWHDVTALRLWIRAVPGERDPGDGGRERLEPWVVSASLDGTVRKWRLADLISPTSKPVEPARPSKAKTVASTTQLTEDEERELAELMDD